MAVLYSLKGKKIYKPDFTTEGLVCYLNTEGKTNSDIHRAKLLDLSGSGNHGTLTNFNFTEESGYVKDLSGGGGLSFDGVDDQLTFTDPIPLRGKRTCFIDFEINEPASEQGGVVEIGGNMYIHNANNKIYVFGVPITTVKTCLEGEHKIVYSQGEDNSNPRIWINGLEDPLYPISTGANPIPQTIGRQGKKFIKKLIIWDRVLTDEEITKLMEVE